MGNILGDITVSSETPNSLLTKGKSSAKGVRASFFQNLDSFVLSYEKEGNRRRIGEREGG